MNIFKRSNFRLARKCLDKVFAVVASSEALRLLAILLLTAYAYQPFFSAANMGALDAQYYQYMLHDAIIQLDNGFFPSYFGQSLFLPNGTPVLLAPYYLMLGQLLNILSFGALNALLVQHLTVFVSALSAAVILYLAIRNMTPVLRWQAVVLAFAYISSPGVMSLIFHMDMYLSFMAVPFVSAVFYGLARVYQRDDAIAYVLSASALALVWMAHPPIALWVSIFSFIFCVLLIIFAKISSARFILLGLMFLLLSYWQFFPIFSLSLNSPNHVPWGDARQIIGQLLLPLPDAFLPLARGKNGLYFLQLGYLLWFVIAIAAVMAFRPSGTFLQRLLLVLVAVILLLLYPLPGIGYFLWSNVPVFILKITYIWPHQRLYVILASAACLVGALSLQQISRSTHQALKVLVGIGLTGLFAWNIHEVNYFIRHGNIVKNSNESAVLSKDSWNSANNIYYFVHYLPDEYAGYLIRLGLGQHVPQLQSRLLDSQKTPVNAFDNEQFVINQCLASANTRAGEFGSLVKLPLETVVKEPLPIATLSLRPGIHYLMCVDMLSSRGEALFQLLDEQRRERGALEVQGPTARRQFGIPFYFADETGKRGAAEVFDLRVWSREQLLVNLYNIGVTSYDPSSLPIVVESYTPYRAKVVAKPDHKYLEIIKLHVPGYIARVNGVEVPVMESERKTIIIPLEKNGMNNVDLSYVGTPGMRISLYVSAISWALVFIFLIMKLMPRRRRTQ